MTRNTYKHIIRYEETKEATSNTRALPLGNHVATRQKRARESRIILQQTRQMDQMVTARRIRYGCENGHTSTGHTKQEVTH